MDCLIRELEKDFCQALTKFEIPDFRPGDTVSVDIRVIEGSRERLQTFTGLCIARKNRSLNSSFTLRKISHGVGVERVFPLYSPVIAAIRIDRCGRVVRAKLYYVRKLTGKAARIREDVARTNLVRAKSKA